MLKHMPSAYRPIKVFDPTEQAVLRIIVLKQINGRCQIASTQRPTVVYINSNHRRNAAVNLSIVKRERFKKDLFNLSEDFVIRESVFSTNLLMEDKVCQIKIFTTRVTKYARRLTNYNLEVKLHYDWFSSSLNLCWV